MDERKQPGIIIYTPPEGVKALQGLLQQGFAVTAEGGCTVKEFLEKECAIDPAYASRRITTIFLNGSPVDDRDTAIVPAGATLSLSGSMPGLMGIMMRSGSPYSAMRRTITHRENPEPGDKTGLVNLKLFNLVLHELGSLFLERGVLVRGSLLEDFISSDDSGIVERMERITVDDRPVTGPELHLFLAGIDESLIDLRVSVTGMKKETEKDGMG